MGDTNLCCSNEDAPSLLNPTSLYFPPTVHLNEELFWQAPCEEDFEDNYTEVDPVLDDLYFRRAQQTLPQTSANPSYDRFFPLMLEP